MGKRSIIIDGPGHLDFVFTLSVYGRNQDPSKKFLFLVDDPRDMPGDPMIMLLTIKKVNGNGKDGEWHFEGEAGDRTFKGFLSTRTGSGWIEAVENCTNDAFLELADKAIKIMKGE